MRVLCFSIEDSLCSCKGIRPARLCTIVLLLMFSNTAAQVESRSFEFEGAQRNYTVFLPEAYATAEELPVVLTMHGARMTDESMMRMTGMNTVADTAGFIVVYPKSGGTFWNTDPSSAPNDLGFIDVLLDTLQQQYRIDPQRVYACGYSSGGFMAMVLACDLSFRIAAYGLVASAVEESTMANCAPPRGLPIMVISGTADPSIPYAGGDGLMPIEESIARLKDIFACGAPDTTQFQDSPMQDNSTAELITYPACSDSVKLAFIKVLNGGHTWPGAERIIPIGTFGETNFDFSANAEFWKFASQYRLAIPEHDVLAEAIPRFLESLPAHASNIAPALLVRNAGLSDEADVSVTCSIDSAGITVYTDTAVLSDLPRYATAKLISFSGWQTSAPFDYQISVHTNLSGDADRSNDTVRTIATVTHLLDDFAIDFSKWNTDGEWGRSTFSAKSGTHSLNHSPQGNYPNNSNTYAEYRYSISLNQINNPELRYWHREFLAGGDSAFVEISVDQGGSWEQIGETHFGSTRRSWEETVIPLSAFTGTGSTDARIRFRVVTDSAAISRGFFVDDIQLGPSDVSTAISGGPDAPIPDGFVLFDAFPNPFNPAAIIRYRLPADSHVELGIYDLRGRQIAELVNGHRRAGTHDVIWRAGTQPSGIYFYRLRAGGSTRLKRMSLVK